MPYACNDDETLPMNREAKQQHTPGPWSFTYGSEFRIMSGAYEVLMIGDKRRAIPCTNDARLIAAAPELLEALRALCAWSDHSALTGLPRDAPVSEDAPSFHDTVNMVHAAIAKATGGEA